MPSAERVYPGHDGAIIRRPTIDQVSRSRALRIWSTETDEFTGRRAPQDNQETGSRGRNRARSAASSIRTVL